MIIIDIYEEFKYIYENIDSGKVKEVYKGWNNYINKYPEIKNIIIESYKEDGFFDLYDIFKEHIYPIFINKWNKFDIAHNNLMKSLNESKIKIEQVVEEEFYTFSFIGLGTGAGHVDQFNNKPAIYFGLEKIVDLGWYEYNHLENLIFHELGHVSQMILRKEDWMTKTMFNNQADYLYWRLYEEGFAQRFSQVITGKNYFHQGKKDDWENWCEKNLSKLCSTYLSYINEGKDEFDFYGVWYEIDGYTETAYYIGTQLIKKLEKSMNLKEIATMSLASIKKEVHNFLKENS